MTAPAVELVGMDSCQAMLARLEDRYTGPAIEDMVLAAADVFRPAVSAAAPRPVGPKLIAANRSEHGSGAGFYADVTPANNLWHVFEEGRAGGYSIPAVRARQRIPLGTILAGYEFGPVTGPIEGGPMAPRPFLESVAEAKADAAGDAALSKLTFWVDDAP